MSTTPTRSHRRAPVSPYHLSAEARETLKARAAELGLHVAQSRQRRMALVNWPQVEAPYPRNAAPWPEGCTHLPAAPAQRGA